MKNKINQDKAIKKCFKITKSFLFNEIEDWLKDMSENGYQLKRSVFFTYTFYYGKPESREYFISGYEEREKMSNDIGKSQRIIDIFYDIKNIMLKKMKI